MVWLVFLSGLQTTGPSLVSSKKIGGGRISSPVRELRKHTCIRTPGKGCQRPYSLVPSPTRQPCTPGTRGWMWVWNYRCSHCIARVQDRIGWAMKKPDGWRGGGRAAPDTRIRWPGPEPVPSQTGTESPQSAPGTVEAVLVQARGNSRTVTGTGPGWRRGTRIWISPAPREEADRNSYQQAVRDTDGR